MSYKLAGLCRKALHKLYWYQKRTLKDGAELLQREKVTEERERQRQTKRMLAAVVFRDYRVTNWKIIWQNCTSAALYFTVKSLRAIADYCS